MLNLSLEIAGRSEENMHVYECNVHFQKNFHSNGVHS